MKFIFNKLLSIKESKLSVFFVSSLVLILVASFFFISNKDTKANVDRICVSYAPLGGSCVIPPGGWSAWSVVTPATPTSTGLIRRIGNGIRENRLKKQFHARRMSCPSGSAQVSAGNSSGATGTYGGVVVVESLGCQLIQEDVINNTTPQCVPPQVMSFGGLCILPTPPDQCYNIDGIQSTVPQGMSQDLTSYSCATISADMCPNITGLQISIPLNKIKNAAGDCVDMDATVVTTVYPNVTNTCISSQVNNIGNKIFVNRPMQWKVDLSSIPSSAVIDNTEWVDDSQEWSAGHTVEGPNNNLVSKKYSTSGVKTISGHTSAISTDGLHIYSVTCTGSINVVVDPQTTE